MTQLEQIRVHYIRNCIREDRKRLAGRVSPAQSRLINLLAEQEFRLGQHLTEQT